MEIRAGIIAGCFTPCVARQATFVMAHLTPGESEGLFNELEGVQPSRSSLDRLPKVLSDHWEQQRRDWDLSLARLTLAEQKGIKPIGLFLGGQEEDLKRMQRLFKHLINTPPDRLPEKLGSMLISLA